MSWIVPLVCIWKVNTHSSSSRFFMLSSRSLIILCFTFKLIHFYLIFVEGIRSMPDSSVSFGMWMSSFSSTIYWKQYLCSTVCLYPRLCVSVDCVYAGCILGALSVLFHKFSLSLLSPIPHCLDCWTFILNFEV